MGMICSANLSLSIVSGLSISGTIASYSVGYTVAIPLTVHGLSHPPAWSILGTNWGSLIGVIPGDLSTYTAGAQQGWAIDATTGVLSHVAALSHDATANLLVKAADSTNPLLFAVANIAAPVNGPDSIGGVVQLSDAMKGVHYSEDLTQPDPGSGRGYKYYTQGTGPLVNQNPPSGIRFYNEFSGIFYGVNYTARAYRFYADYQLWEAGWAFMISSTLVESRMLVKENPLLLNFPTWPVL